MASVIIAAIAAGPASVSADSCKISEYADHIEVVCVGSPASSRALPQKSEPAQRIDAQETSEVIVQQQPAPDTATTVLNGAQTSRIRSQLEAIRTLNSHRFETAVSQPFVN
jgi:hypothetical protein